MRIDPEVHIYQMLGSLVIENKNRNREEDCLGIMENFFLHWTGGI